MFGRGLTNEENEVVKIVNILYTIEL
jgi:hypothetical protein